MTTLPKAMTPRGSLDIISCGQAKNFFLAGHQSLPARLESTGVVAIQGCRDGEEEVSPLLRPERRQVAEVQLLLRRPLPGHLVPGQPPFPGGGPGWRP